MTRFQEVRFRDNIAYSVNDGPEVATSVVITAGHEQRDVTWEEARGRWDVARGSRTSRSSINRLAFLRTRECRA